jgi:hypothetical protein
MYFASTPRVWLSSVSIPMASSALRSSRESMSPLWSKSNMVKALRTLSGTSEAAVTGSRGGAFCPSVRRGKRASRSTPASWPCASSLSVCDQSKVTVDAVSLARGQISAGRLPSCAPGSTWRSFCSCASILMECTVSSSGLGCW